MHSRSVSLAIGAALLLGACAGAQQEPLVLANYAPGQAIDRACLDTMDQASARQAHGGFPVLGPRVTQVIGPPRAAAHVMPGGAGLQGQIVPEGSHPIELRIPTFDNTFTLMYVNCAARQAWFSKRGGVVDATSWFGPFSL